MSFYKRLLLIESKHEDYFLFQFAISDLASDIYLAHSPSIFSAIKNLSDTHTPRYDLIFLNWNMPDTTGEECLVSIRLVQHYCKTPIIVYSTSDIPPDVDEVIHHGACYRFTMPDSSRELTDQLQKIFLKC